MIANEVLRMQNITKIYPNGLVANNDVSFFANSGEIHALLGENGAGKTTLMNVLFGIEDHQEGKIFIKGKETHIKSPLDAIAEGVGMVHQHFMLVPSLTVAENVILGIEPRKHGVLDRAEGIRMTNEVAQRYGFDVQAEDVVKDLSICQQQKVEIIKALIRGVQVLIMDEPTAVLTPQETAELFEQMIKLKESGYAIIFITHKLDEVIKICDRITILRHGCSIATEEIGNLTEAKISRMMVGRDIVQQVEKGNAEVGKALLEVKQLTHRNLAGKKLINNISFTLREGEILGVAGVEGNGQSELIGVLSGMRPFGEGDIKLHGQSIRGKSVRELRALGVSHISEDRMNTSTSLDSSIKDNFIANLYNKKHFRKGPFLDMKKINAHVDQLIKEYEIKCDDRDEKIRALSGGNIQKCIVAREFSAENLSVILANQPTRGIDVGATEFIRKTLIRLTREKHIATLLVTADLNEVLEVSDRLIVMYKGEIVAHFTDMSAVTEELLGEYMLGIKKMTESEMMLA